MTPLQAPSGSTPNLSVQQTRRSVRFCFASIVAARFYEIQADTITYHARGD